MSFTNFFCVLCVVLDCGRYQYLTFVPSFVFVFIYAADIYDVYKINCAVNAVCLYTNRRFQSILSIIWNQ